MARDVGCQSPLPTLTTTWYTDSGASRPMCSGLRHFSNLLGLEKPYGIALGDSLVIFAFREGSRTFDIGHGLRHTLHDVLYVPDVKSQLISLSSLNEAGYSTTLSNRICQITSPDGQLICSTSLVDGMYLLDNFFPVPSPSCMQAHYHANTSPNLPNLSSHLWHCRLGHRSLTSILTMPNNLVLSMRISSILGETPACPSCIQSKQHCFFSSRPSTRAVKPL